MKNTNRLLIDLVGRKMQGEINLNDLEGKVKWDFPELYDEYRELIRSAEDYAESLVHKNSSVSGFTGQTQRVPNDERLKQLIEILKRHSTLKDLPI